MKLETAFAASNMDALVEFYRRQGWSLVARWREDVREVVWMGRLAVQAQDIRNLRYSVPIPMEAA